MPVGPEIMAEAEPSSMPSTLYGHRATINLVWTPFWSPDRIEPRVRAYLGI